MALTQKVQDHHSQNRSEISRRAAETRKVHNPNAFKEMGEKGAQARHDKTPEEESAIAKKAAATRKENDPDAFRAMGEKGGKARRSKADDPRDGQDEEE